MIKVFGHQRSGTHYLAALISINLYNDDNYLNYYYKNPHILGNRLNNILNKNPDIIPVYIQRDFEPVSKSIFKARKRFGLNVDNYNTFLKTKYKDMWTKNIGEFKIKVNTLNSEKYINKVSTGFRNINETPYEYWMIHINSWKKPNVIKVKYEDLKSDFEKVLLKIAKEANIKHNGKFENIKQQVGWIP